MGEMSDLGALGANPCSMQPWRAEGLLGGRCRWAWVLAREGMGVSGPWGQKLSATERGAAVM